MYIAETLNWILKMQLHYNYRNRGVYTRGEWCEMHHGENWGVML